LIYFTYADTFAVNAYAPQNSGHLDLDACGCIHMLPDLDVCGCIICALFLCYFPRLEPSIFGHRPSDIQKQLELTNSHIAGSHNSAPNVTLDLLKFHDRENSFCSLGSLDTLNTFPYVINKCFWRPLVVK
jgi:hypothetical protein